MTRYTARGRERERSKKKLSERIGDSSFAAIPKNFLRSDALMNLSGSACKLLFEFIRQVGKDNNGDLMAAWSVLKDRGWRSKDTLNNALRELREAGIITQTRQGGRNKCSLYALTFIAIDECLEDNGISKHNHRPSTRPLGLWHEERKEARDQVPSTKPRKKEESA